MTKSLKQFLHEDKLIKNLYRKISSTAIDKDGQTKEHSLRKIEVTVPLILFAEICNCEDIDKMKMCLQYIKRLGLNRNRGLGRCDMTIVEDIKND